MLSGVCLKVFGPTTFKSRVGGFPVHYIATPRPNLQTRSCKSLSQVEFHVWLSVAIYTHVELHMDHDIMVLIQDQCFCWKNLAASNIEI